MFYKVLLIYSKGTNGVKLDKKLDIKVFILYLMKNVGEPLEFTTICDIVIQDEFVNYFDFAVCFPELLENGQIEEIGEGPDKLYAVTASGAESLESYESSLLTVIKDRALRSALRLIAFNKNGSRVRSSITECGEGYNLNCRIEDREKTVFSIDIYLSDKNYAERMKFNFDERAEIIYRGALSLLSGDVNFIFDE